MPELEIEVQNGPNSADFSKQLMTAIHRLFQRDDIFHEANNEKWHSRRCKCVKLIVDSQKLHNSLSSSSTAVGSFTLLSGATYAGDWLDAKFNGMGSLRKGKWNGFDVDFDGEFKDGAFNG